MCSYTPLRLYDYHTGKAWDVTARSVPPNQYRPDDAETDSNKKQSNVR